MTDKIPDKIYLQQNGDGEDLFITDCATWADERVFDSDVEYVRAEVITAIQAAGSIGQVRRLLIQHGCKI